MLRCFMFFGVLLCPLLLGCATQQPPKQKTPQQLTGAMLTVRLLTKQEPTEPVAVQVAQGEQFVPMASVRGMPASRVAGHWVDYVFPVPLPPGRYKISSGSGLPLFELAFEVPAVSPVYIGRLLLSQGSAPVLEDRSRDDIPMLRNVVAHLRSVAITSQVGSLRQVRPPEADRAVASSTTPVVAPGSEASRGVVASGDTLELVPVAEVLVDELPVAFRKAFKRYLKLREPRAFAVEDNGAAYGVAEGKDVIERAIQNCNKLAPKKPCRLLSVNQTATLMQGKLTHTARLKEVRPRLADAKPPNAALGTNAGTPALAQMPPRSDENHNTGVKANGPSCRAPGALKWECSLP